MFELKDKTALVTGATGGLGEAIARMLATAGARVAISGTRKEKLEALSGELPGAVALPVDLSDSTAVEGLVPAAIEALGRVDILVNNAGITRDMLALRMKDEDWDSVLAVNLSAAFRLARAALRPMMRARSGRIISITSIVGVTGNPGQANYAASKAGIIGMSKALAQEVAARGVTVNCVAPGFIETPMTDVLDERQKERILQNVPIGRLGLPEEVAAAVVFLASDEACYITGHTLHVNGGLAMI